MLFREFDIDEAMRVRKEEGRKEGKEEGKKEGREEGKEEGREEIAIKLLKRKMALEEIKEITNLPLEILYEIQRAQR